MLALVLRGFMQRKLRVLLTAIAIALGVALMAGTYILTDTINQSFAGIFQTANRGHDVVDHAEQAARQQTRRRSRRSPKQMLAQVRAHRRGGGSVGLDLLAGDPAERRRQAPEHRRGAGVRRL